MSAQAGHLFGVIQTTVLIASGSSGLG